MNDTAKKLREAAAYIKDYGVASVMAIARVRDALGVGKTDAISRDLGAIIAHIADELDELDDKAARRRSHIVKLESTIAERNRELRELRKQVPSERERQILDMWPRYEDGEPVWFGDEIACGGAACDLEDVKLVGQGADYAESYLYASRGHDVFEVFVGEGERVKRPVQSVLDADGVEIKVGDSMYVANFGDGPYIVCDIDENIDRIELFWHENRNEKLFIAANRLTHTRPDSWEQLEEDAEFNDETGIVGGNLDIVRRAKALAGVEVDE